MSCAEAKNIVGPFIRGAVYLPLVASNSLPSSKNGRASVDHAVISVHLSDSIAIDSSCLAAIAESVESILTTENPL